MRQFRDETGVEWRVSFTPRGSDAVSRENYLPEAYRGGWLVFESAQEKRRLAPVPANWEQLTTAELAALCSKASTQPARARAGAAAGPVGGPESKTEAPTTLSGDPLRPQLKKAEQQLDRTLAEVCETETAARLDTGELIRVEENLALAAEAAKEAVSLRRRMHADQQRESGEERERLPGSDAAPRPREEGGQHSR
jgi:hypothetical protein